MAALEFFQPPHIYKAAGISSDDLLMEIGFSKRKLFVSNTQIR